MKKLMLSLVMLLLMLSFVSAVDKIPVITFAEVSDNMIGTERNPERVFVLNSLITKQQQNIEPDYSSGASIGLMNVFYEGEINKRHSKVPADKMVMSIHNRECSIYPEHSGIFRTTPTTTSICYQNPNDFGVSLRIFDADNDVNFVKSIPINKKDLECTEVEPSHNYVYDIIFCNNEVCDCSPWENVQCQIQDGKMVMVRERNCLAECSEEETTVDWIDTTVKGCALDNKCYETDGGIDTNTFGTTKKGNIKESDVCIGKEEVLEHYCDSNNVKSIIHTCASTQECKNGECIDKPVSNCGYINDQLRLDSAQWCDGKDLKSCNKGIVLTQSNSIQCMENVCNYAGQLLERGEKICSDNGRSVLTCANPSSDYNQFTVDTCGNSKKCERNTRMTDCETVKYSMPEPTKVRFTIWDLIEKLFGGRR